jgi:hypothetical protein
VHTAFCVPTENQSVVPYASWETARPQEMVLHGMEVQTREGSQFRHFIVSGQRLANSNISYFFAPLPASPNRIQLSRANAIDSDKLAATPGKACFHKKSRR